MTLLCRATSIQVSQSWIDYFIKKDVHSNTVCVYVYVSSLRQINSWKNVTVLPGMFGARCDSLRSGCKTRMFRVTTFDTGPATLITFGHVTAATCPDSHV